MNDWCYWYDEDKNMGATIPYCRLKDLYGSDAIINYENIVGECPNYISKADVDTIIKEHQRNAENLYLKQI